MAAEKKGFIDALWDELLPLTLKSPIALFSLVVAALMGYGISFLLFDYRRNPRGISNWVHLFAGGGYSMLVFLIVNWNLVFSGGRPLTLESLAEKSPQTMVLSFALLFVVFCVVTLWRERQRRP